jgi:hypothetical protein
LNQSTVLRRPFAKVSGNRAMSNADRPNPVGKDLAISSISVPD